MSEQNYKYFIYCRKSNGNEESASPSIDAQYRELVTYAERNGLHVIGVFKEIQSAFEVGRPKFAEMVERIKDGDANSILTWEISRLSRNISDNSVLDSLLKRKQLLKIQTPTRDYIDAEGDDFMLNMELVISRQYSKEISKRVKRGLRFKLSNKEWPCSAPLGYINFSRNKTMTGYMTPERRSIEKMILDKCASQKRDIRRTEIDPIKGPLIKKLFEDFATGNYSIVSIIQRMENLGLRNKFGQTVSKNCVFTLLRNPFYYGAMKFNSSVQEGNHEPLITKSLFDKVQEVIGIRNKPLKKKWQFNFTGFIKCGECGCGITGYKKIKNNKYKGKTEYIYYGCTHMRDIGRKRPCTQRAITESDLKKQIEKTVKKIQMNDMMKELITESIKRSHEKEKEMHNNGLHEWQNMYYSAENKLNKLFELFYSGSINQTEFDQRKETIMNDKQRAKEHLDAHSDAQKAWLKYSENLIVTVNHVYRIFKEGTPEEVKLLMMAIGKNYALIDGEITFQLKEPYNYIVRLFELRSSNKTDMRDYTMKLEPFL
jgi:DNA invertase Pin-like site-specific DNA recombinase/predicted metal-binding protein